jgi:hypothetical protein
MQCKAAIITSAGSCRKQPLFCLVCTGKSRAKQTNFGVSLKQIIMTTEKRTNVIYWSATTILFLFEGVVPALTSHTDLAVEGIRHLGYPDYFRVLLTVFKVAGALALLLPFVKGRVKEWAYAGFAFTILSAFISHWAVDGFSGQTLFPLVVFAILVVSYVSYGKRLKQQHTSEVTFKSNNYVLSGIPQ